MKSLGWLRAFRQVCLASSLLLVPLAASAAITLTGADGQSVTLAAPATRIVSLAPDLTELAYDVGAGADMAGAGTYSNYPAAAKKLPRVGNAFGFDLERIVALKPDLILAWQGGTPVTFIERLRALKLPVLVIGTHKLADIAANLELIGRATGHEAEAHKAAADFLAGLEKLRHRYANQKSVRVFYEISATPLYTVGGRQIISRVIELCGGQNIFADLTALAAPVSLGTVLARDPQAIVTGDDPGSAAHLQEWQRWPQISAVKTHSLFRISGDLLARATPRILQGGQELCEDLEKARERHKEPLTKPWPNPSYRLINDDGTIFKVTPSGTETVLYSFVGGGDGADPHAGVIQGRDGDFHGATDLGGADSLGTVFELTPSGIETILHFFDGSDGANDWTNLVRGSDGNLYESTYAGGTDTMAHSSKSRCNECSMTTGGNASGPDRQVRSVAARCLP